MENRTLSVEDTATLHQSKIQLAHATKRLAAFTAFDAVLDAAWLTSWQAAIDASENFDTDETYLDQLTTFTAAVKTETDLTLTTLRDLRYYAGKAFGKNTARYKAFGFARMSNLSQKTAAFILFVTVNHRLAVQLQAALSAAGMSAAQILALNTAAANLAQAEVAQELHKRNRTIAAEQRIENINLTYRFMQQAGDAADIIYSTDDETRGLFAIEN